MRVPMKHGLPLRAPGRVSMTVARSMDFHGTRSHLSPGVSVRPKMELLA